MTRPIGLYLVDFGRHMPQHHLAGLNIGGVDAATPPEMDDVEERLDQARRAGLAQGEAAAEGALSALNDRIAALEADHATAMEAAREAWAEQQGDAMAALVRSGLTALETKLADAVADLLQPVLNTAIRIKAVDEIRIAITSLLSAGDGPLIRVSGPADLVEILKAGLSASPVLDFVVADAPDMTVTAGDTTIRSQLATWSARLDACVRETR